MRSWTSPVVPDLTSYGVGPAPRVYDSSRRAEATLEPAAVATQAAEPADSRPDPAVAEPAGLYVCGITPYDATHMGHAATYVTFDVLQRALRAAGRDVHYVQNVTDVDDPLLERAERDGIDWRELAEREIQLFRDDMSALRVIPPRDYRGVVESIDPIAQAVATLLAHGTAYELAAPDAQEPGAADVYLDLAATTGFGQVSGFTRDEMLAVFADRGGDPEREGKRDALDPLLWRAARPGEPSWSPQGRPVSSGPVPGAASDASQAYASQAHASQAHASQAHASQMVPTLAAGRPGWHIECTCIALDRLGDTFDVQGGGVDLVFPHHEMSAVQADALHGPGSFARTYVHQEMVGLDGAKMSKSRGNLVLVSRLRAQGVDPMAIRLVLLDHHYRTPWEWTDDALAHAQERLARWRGGIDALGQNAALALLTTLRERVADDLDTPGALAAVDAALNAAVDAAAHGDAGPGDATADTPADIGEQPDHRSRVARDAVDALLGIAL